MGNSPRERLAISPLCVEMPLRITMFRLSYLVVALALIGVLGCATESDVTNRRIMRKPWNRFDNPAEDRVRNGRDPLNLRPNVRRFSY